ncbi:regulator [Francisellaceae bacterium CB300]
MKKMFFILIILFSISDVYASYTHTQAFFDDYNHITDDNFVYKNNTYRQDAKIKKYGSEYDISKSSDYNCEYNASGQLRCWKYKIREVQDKNSGISKKILADYNNRKQMKDVSSGDDFNCALDSGNEAFCWGSNKRGQLGTEAVTKVSKEPIKVDSEVEFKKIYTKAHYACGLDLGGHVYCWGDGSNGEVGNGKKGKFNTPQKVETDRIFSRLSMARTYTCGVEKLTNNIYCWGKGTKDLSSSINLDSSIPIKI